MRLQTMILALCVLVMTYFVSLGATFNGVLLTDFKVFTLGLMAVLVMLWWVVRWRRGWLWHVTVLDRVILLWIAAFVLSLGANPETWRRSAIGLWYVGVYIGVWYALHDVLANRAVRKDILIDALLIAGLVVIVFGYWQMTNALSQSTNLLAVRPVSLLGNSNALGAFLVVLTPFAYARSRTARLPVGRTVMTVYALLAALLLLMTFSRGAWLGLVALVVSYLGLQLYSRQLLSFTALRAWWGTQSRRMQMVTGVGTVAVIVAAVAAIALFIQSFTIGGRSTDLRLPIYQSAIEQFGASPLFGNGLFTFGRGLIADWSMPPNQPHAHAHDIPLNIAAELGLVGLAALGATLYLIYRRLRDNIQAAIFLSSQITLFASIAAVVGFGVHHLVDMPAMMPAIALTGLLALVLATAPTEPQPVTLRVRRVGHIGALGVLWLGLIVTGLWSSSLYRQYIGVLQDAVNEGDYVEAARRLQPIIDADPSLAILHMEQGFLFGMAAADHDVEAMRAGIAAYARFLELEPSHAVSWVNVAALHWQRGDRDTAVFAMSRAVVLAPDEPLFQRNLQAYSGIGDAIVQYEPDDITLIDYERGISFGRFQYLREVIARQFLPQVGYAAIES